MGKPFLPAFYETMWAASILRYYAGYADKVGGKTIPIGKILVHGKFLSISVWTIFIVNVRTIPIGKCKDNSYW
jgi:hypothetical protein